MTKKGFAAIRNNAKYFPLLAGLIVAFLYVNYAVNLTQYFWSKDRGRPTNLPSGNVPSLNFLCYTYYGRLGNHMFQFASLTGIAILNNLTIIVGKEDSLYKIFDLKNVVVLDNRDVCNTFEFKEEGLGCCKFDKSLMKLPKGKSFKICYYLQSWMYFYHVKDEIRRQFQFRDNIKQKVNHIMKNMRLRYEYKYPTLIGIHVRIGDLADEMNNKYGLVIAPEGYIYKAMDYMKSKFLQIIFVVASDDLQWSKTVLKVRSNDSIHFLEGNAPEIDLAVMTSCTHVIQTVGTFGWWAGFLTQGLSIYYPHPGRIGSPIEARYNYTEYYPPDWIAIDI